MHTATLICLQEVHGDEYLLAELVGPLLKRMGFAVFHSFSSNSSEGGVLFLVKTPASLLPFFSHTVIVEGRVSKLSFCSWDPRPPQHNLLEHPQRRALTIRGSEGCQSHGE